MHNCTNLKYLCTTILLFDIYVELNDRIKDELERTWKEASLLNRGTLQVLTWSDEDNHCNQNIESASEISKRVPQNYKFDCLMLPPNCLLRPNV
jgi:hypothetical protein